MQMIYGRIHNKIKKEEDLAFAREFSIMSNFFLAVFLHHPVAPGMISLIPIVTPLLGGNVIVWLDGF
jgi:hypothetical protein